MSFASVGVHARNAATQTADKQAVQAAHVEGVKLLVGGNEMGDIDAYRTAGVNSFHARLYTAEPAHGTGMTAAKFVQVFTPAIQAYIAKGITAFEIHNEPNLTIEGYNVSWRSPQQFAAWFLKIVQGLRTQFGHTIRLGFPALSPARLMVVLRLQFAEGLSDRQAADAARARLDCKYLLGLELADPGFDASVLSEFRTRLIENEWEPKVLDKLLAVFRERGLLKARGQQRTDSTVVRGAVRDLNRLELVGETVRHALSSLAVAGPAWLRAHHQPE